MSDSFRTEVLLRSEQTGGRVAVVRNTVPAGWAGPPLHHHAFDEAFYVLDGELTFQVADRRVTAGPGALAFAPRDVVHTLANHGDTAATYLLVITPGGFENYFDELAGQPTGKPYPETTVVGGVLDARAPDGTVDAPAGPIRVLLHGGESGGAVGIVDNDIGAGSLGPHLHTHDFDEAFCVLDGALTFQVGDALVPGRRRRGRVRAADRAAHVLEPRRRPRALPDRHHRRRVRAPLRPHRGEPRGRRAAGVGARPGAAERARGPADRGALTRARVGRGSDAARRGVGLGAAVAFVAPSAPRSRLSWPREQRALTGRPPAARAPGRAQRRARSGDATRR